MHIVIIHQYYLMPGMPGGSRFNEFARLWSEAGHEVTVIAGTVDYSSGQTPERYRRRWITEERDGLVRVLRCYVSPAYGKGMAGRMWAFASFTASALTAVAKVRRPSVVIATSPPLLTVIPGYVLGRTLRRCPWVFEVRDLWPESAVTTGVLREGSWVVRGLYGLEKWAYESADRINVLTPAFRDDITSRGLALPEKILFVPNGADVEAFKPEAPDARLREALGWRNRFVVLYAGAHGLANALTQLIDAAEHLKDHPEILIATVGDGPERPQLIDEARRRGLDNIQFLGARPKEEMPALINAADVGAAVLQRNRTFLTVYPNKVFDYMACAKPVLLAIDGVARELVCDEAQAGLFAEPENGAQLAERILSFAEAPALRAKLGERGRAWVHANATRTALARRYLEHLTDIAGNRSAARA